MFPIQDHLSVATKKNLESQFALATAFARSSFEGAQKLFSLNLNVAKTSLAESAVIGQQFASAKDPNEIINLVTALAQPTAEKALAYSRHLANIASSTQAELAEAAEAQLAEANRNLKQLVNDVTKNAPAGAENVVALVKTAIENANAGYEQLSKTSRQAAEAIEANISAAATQFAKTAEKAAS